jgi:hypothetical protein
VRYDAALDNTPELAADVLGDCQEWPEWTRSEERVAGAPQDPRRAAVVFAEAPQKSGLTYPSFASDEGDTPSRATPYLVEPRLERGTSAGALEQIVRRTRRAREPSPLHVGHHALEHAERATRERSLSDLHQGAAAGRNHSALSLDH